jgi:anaerobic selenocysteine-containing dehydrogenase
MKEEIRKTICLHCPPGCGIDVHVKDNKPVKVEGMMESIVGPICIKAEVIPEWYEVGLKERLLHPLKKDGVGWKQISWDEALDIIATKFQQIKDIYGPQAVAEFAGQIATNRDWYYPNRKFFEAFGSPSVFCGLSFCWTNRLPSCVMTYGQYAVPTIRRSKCIVCWAGNPVNTVPFAGDGMLTAKRKGESKLLVVDCRRTTLAKEADTHAMLLPGTDPAFGLGLLNVIISEGLYDKEFVDKWTVGFDRLAERVKDYPPERVAEITTVPADTIREFARTYATNKPATIFWGNTLDNVDNGFQAHRCIQVLTAITGNLDIPGGSRMIPLGSFNMVPHGEPYPLNFEELLPLRKWLKMKVAGEDEHPLWVQMSAEGPAAAMIDAIITGKPYPIKALFVEASNLHTSWANTNKLNKALSMLDFLVVFDVNMTETAEFADIVLPAATFLEQRGIYQYVGRSMYVLQERVIEPPEDCWSDMKFWLELSKRMGFKEQLPWDTPEEVMNHLLKPVNLTLDDLKANPGGVFYSKAGITWKKYEQEGFKTPSGKVEIYSQRIAELGGDPLPGYVPPAQSPARAPWLARSYPLVLITGTRMLEFNHSMLHSLPTLRDKVPEPFVELNAETAKKMGISDGDMVIVQTTTGSVRMKAKLSDDIHPKVVSTSHAWWRMANGNWLTNDDLEMREPLTGAPAMRALACRVVKDVELG